MHRPRARKAGAGGPRRPARACIRIQGCRRQFGAAAAARPSPRGALAAPAAPSLAAAEPPIATAVANAVSAALAAHLAALAATHGLPRPMPRMPPVRGPSRGEPPPHHHRPRRATVPASASAVDAVASGHSPPTPPPTPPPTSPPPISPHPVPALTLHTAPAPPTASPPQFAAGRSWAALLWATLTGSPRARPSSPGSCCYCCPVCP